MQTNADDCLTRRNDHDPGRDGACSAAGTALRAVCARRNRRTVGRRLDLACRRRSFGAGTATSAFFATFHPDFSNVELDQQTIAPSVYQRVINEVRPFFTQAAPFYNTFNCNVCNGFRTTLYTPAIPTPSQGYAFEGRQGDFGFASFDAIGVNRDDSAAALDYTSPDAHWQASAQHVTADIPGVVDDADEVGVNYSSLKYLSGYVNFSTDRGTNVLDPGGRTQSTAAADGRNQNFAFFASARKVGAYFNPVDGFDSHPDIAGYGTYMVRIWTLAPQSVLQSIGISGFMDRYQGTTMGANQSDNAMTLDILTKSAWDLQLDYRLRLLALRQHPHADLAERRLQLDVPQRTAK